MRGVTASRAVTVKRCIFLLTRLMRGVTHHLVAAGCMDEISTHTPHARRDSESKVAVGEFSDFYSHASCEA